MGVFTLFEIRLINDSGVKVYNTAKKQFHLAGRRIVGSRQVHSPFAENIQ